MPIARQMDKQNVVFLYNSTRLGNKREGTTDVHNMDEFHSCFAEQKKPEQLCGPIYAHLWGCWIGKTDGNGGQGTLLGRARWTNVQIISMQLMICSLS